MNTQLRRRAEELLRANPREIPTLSTSDVQQLVHELRVYQVELEMQNAELRAAQEQLARSRDAYAELYDCAPVGYITLDRAGTIVEANQMVANLLHIERGQLIHRTFSDFVAHDTQEDWSYYRRLLSASKENVMVELALCTADGSSFTAILESRPLSEESEDKWRCMMVLMIMRAATLRRITESQKRRLFMQRGKLGYRRDEPIFVEREQPGFVKGLIRFHLEELGYSVEQLSGVLNILEREVYDLYPRALRKPLRLVE